MMVNALNSKTTCATIFMLAGTLFAEEEFIFTSLIADNETPVTLSASDIVAATEEEEIFSSLQVQPSVSSETPEKSIKPAAAAPTKTDIAPVMPKKRLRDPFWPVGYIPEIWKEKEVDLDPSTVASLDKQWAEAAQKIKVSFTKMVGGQRVAFVNRKMKKPGDTIDVQHAGKTFQFKLGKVYSSGKLGLKKGRVE